MGARDRFEPQFCAEFMELLASRRDVRRFRPDPLSDDVVAELVAATRLGPSVGYSQPWRFVRVDAAERRAAVIASFERANSDARAAFAGERAKHYAALKLAGLREAPVHLAVFCDESTETGGGLGARTMPETRAYSTVNAVYTLWLVARTHGIGVGWVSILEPDVVQAVLDVPAEWRFVAYLCLGYPQTYDDSPELERAGWERYDERSTTVLRR